MNGPISEAFFACEAIRRGWLVYTTNVGHNEPADAIIVRPPNRPIAVQIKTATIAGDRNFSYGVLSCRGRGKNKRTYRKGDFDVLAALLPDLQKFVFWGFEEIAERKRITYSPRLHRQPDNWDLLDKVTSGQSAV